MYVEELIGADTIDTMPIETLAAFREHGKARPSLESDLDQAKATLAELEAAGVSLRAVTDDLIVDGIQKFQEPRRQDDRVAGDPASLRRPRPSAICAGNEPISGSSRRR